MPMCDIAAQLVELSGKISGKVKPDSAIQAKVQLQAKAQSPNRVHVQLRVGCFPEEDQQHPYAVFICSYELDAGARTLTKFDAMTAAWPLLRTSLVNHSRLLNVQGLDVLPVLPPKDQLLQESE